MPAALFVWCAATSLVAQTATITPVSTPTRTGGVAYDYGRGRAVKLREYAHNRYDLVAFDGATWVPVLPGISIASSDDWFLASDHKSGGIVAINRDGAQAVAIRGGAVTLLPNVPSTSPLFGISGRPMVHDSARDELFVFGGFFQDWLSNVHYVTNTYALRAGSWQVLTPAQGPSARAHHALVDDPNRQVLVLYGGSGPNGTLGDTWEWNGSAWSEVANVTGPIAGPATGTWDDAAGEVVILDHQRAAWAFDGASWVRRGTNVLPLVGRVTPFFDGARVVVNTERTQHSGAAAAIQELVGATWRELAGSQEFDPTTNVSMAFDSTRNEVICIDQRSHHGETWTWNGRLTRHHGTRPLGPLAFDERRGEGVLWGDGTFLGETWTWNGATWTRRTPATTPPPRSGAALAYDAVRQVTLLFGGTVNGQWTAGTWLWDGVDWSADPGPQPPAGDPSIFVFDRVRAAVVMTGGHTYPNETWEWNGQWQRRSATSGRNGRGVFDVRLGRVVAFDQTGTLQPTIMHEWDGSTWITTNPSSAPIYVLGVGGFAADTIRQRTIHFGGRTAGDVPTLNVIGTTPAVVEDLGGACPNTPKLAVEERPALGHTMTVGATIEPQSWGVFAFSWQPVPTTVGPCTLWVDGTLGTYFRFAPRGDADLPIAIPNTLGLRGASFVVQMATLPGGYAAIGNALVVRIGD